MSSDIFSGVSLDPAIGQPTFTELIVAKRTTGVAIKTICDSTSGEEVCDEGNPPSIALRQLAYGHEVSPRRNRRLPITNVGPNNTPTRQYCISTSQTQAQFTPQSKIQKAKAAYDQAVFNGVSPFALSMECDDGEEEVSHTDFTSGTGGWQGGVIGSGSYTLSNSNPTSSQLFSDLRAERTFSVKVRRGAITSGATITVSIVDINGTTITTDEFVDSDPVFGITGTIPEDGQVRVAISIAHATASEFSTELIEIQTCQTSPPICDGGVSNVQFVIKWAGTPRQPVNIFEAFVKYKIRSKADETKISYIYQRPSNIGHLTGDTCDFWKQQGEGGFSSDEVLIGIYTDPRLISTDEALSVADDTNWLWSIPNGGEILDELYLGFPSHLDALATTIASGDECESECIVEAVSLLLLVNRIDNSGTDITGDEGCSPDPGDRLTVLLRYVNPTCKEREFATTLLLSTVYADEADTSGWDTVSGLGNGVPGSAARWEEMEFILDNPAGTGLAQCSEQTVFEATGVIDDVVPSLTLRTAGGFVREPCDAVVPVTTIVDGGIYNTIQTITLPSPAYATGYYVAMTKDGAFDEAFVQWDAPSTVLRAAIGSLLDIGAANLIVTGIGTASDPFVVEFAGIWTGISMPLLEVTVAGDDGALITSTADGYHTSWQIEFEDGFFESTTPVPIEEHFGGSDPVTDWISTNPGRLVAATVDGIPGLRVIDGAPENAHICVANREIADGVSSMRFMIERVVGADDLDIGLVFRYDSTTDYMAAIVQCSPVGTTTEEADARLQIWQMVSGVKTVLVDTAITISIEHYYRIKVRYYDDEIDVALFDAEVNQLAFATASVVNFTNVHNTRTGVYFGHDGSADYKSHVRDITIANNPFTDGTSASTSAVQSLSVHRFVNEISMTVIGGPVVFDAFGGSSVPLGAHPADTGQAWTMHSGATLATIAHNASAAPPRLQLRLAASSDATVLATVPAGLEEARTSLIVNSPNSRTIAGLVLRYVDEDNYVFAFLVRAARRVGLSVVPEGDNVRVGIGRRINGCDHILDAGRLISGTNPGTFYDGVSPVVIRSDLVNDRIRAIGGVNTLGSAASSGVHLDQECDLTSIPMMFYDGAMTGSIPGKSITDLESERIWVSEVVADSDVHVLLDRVSASSTYGKVVNILRIGRSEITQDMHGGGIVYTDLGDPDGWLEADVRLYNLNTVGAVGDHAHMVRAGVAFRVVDANNYWAAYYYKGPGIATFYLTRNESELCYVGTERPNSGLEALMEMGRTGQLNQWLINPGNAPPGSVIALPIPLINNLVPFVTDSFNGTNGTTLTSHPTDFMQQWNLVNSVGTELVEIQGNVAKLEHPGTGTIHRADYIVSSAQYADVYATAQIYVSNGAGDLWIGFIFRYTDANNYIIARMHVLDPDAPNNFGHGGFGGGHLQIAKVEGGVEEVLNEGFITHFPNSTFNLVAMASGSWVYISTEQHGMGAHTSFNMGATGHGITSSVKEAGESVTIENLNFFTILQFPQGIYELTKYPRSIPILLQADHEFWVPVGLWSADITNEPVADGEFDVTITCGPLTPTIYSTECRLRIVGINDECNIVAATDWSPLMTTYDEYTFTLLMIGLATSGAVTLQVELQGRKTSGFGPASIRINGQNEPSFVRAPWQSAPGLNQEYTEEIRLSQTLDGVETIYESEAFESTLGLNSPLPGALCRIRVDCNGGDITARYRIPAVLDTTFELSTSVSSENFEDITNFGALLRVHDAYAETIDPIDDGWWLSIYGIARLLFGVDAEQPVGDRIGLFMKTDTASTVLVDELQVFTPEPSTDEVTTDVILRNNSEFDVQTALIENIPWLAGDGIIAGPTTTNNQQNIITSAWTHGSLIDSATISFRRALAVLDIPEIIVTALNVPETGPIIVERIQDGGYIDTIQSIRIRAAGGSFRIRITINGSTVTTGPIAWNTTAEALQSVFEAMDEIATGEVAVVGRWPKFTITFVSTLDVKDPMVPLTSNLVCDPFDLGPVPAPPYPYDLSPLPGDDPADPVLSGPIPDSANFFVQTTFERHLIDPNGTAGTVRDIALSRGLDPNNYTPYLRSCDGTLLTPVGFGTEISTKESYLLVENTIDSLNERNRILEYLASHKHILPARFVWDCWEP